MQIGKRGYPYPILNNATNYNCYKKSTYSLEYESEEEHNNFTLKNVRIETNSDELKCLIEKKLVKAMIVIESSSTIFKYSEEISTTPKNIVIPIGNLSGKIEISSIVYATENIVGFSSNDFTEDFDNYKFNIEKYCPIAIDDGYVVKVEYNDFDDRKVSSIFSVVESYDSELKNMKVINGDRKIKIELPEDEFKKFDALNGQSIFYNIFFSIIIIPALSSCLKDFQSEVKYQEKTIEDISDSHSWFLSIQNVYKKIYNNDIKDEEFINLDALEFSQTIFDYCTVNSIKDFYDIIKRKTDTSEEDEENV